ncbi:hypothetical protein EDB87DRAFT_1764446 [Lactarius vividus]|nr:hypothetical protein EDB87DRAFT_1764446 [Lactarius vividus]
MSDPVNDGYRYRTPILLMSAFFFDPFRLIKYGLPQFRPASPQHNSRSLLPTHLCKMRVLMSMTILMLVLSVAATPLKQAKINRGDIGRRDSGHDDHGEGPKHKPKHHKPSKHFSTPSPTYHYSHTTPTDYYSHTTPTDHYPHTTPAYHYSHTTSGKMPPPTTSCSD